MENYRGIKFSCQRIAEDFDLDARLMDLDRWVYILAELGLAPVHAEGAYGNHSLRVEGESFVITKTGMIPKGKMDEQNYCLVQSYDEQLGRFVVRGASEPSSESFLHLYIYRAFPLAKTIMHGHSMLMNEYADALDIPVTDTKFPYGTVELARSALEILSNETPFIILKDHGFVAMGPDIKTTGNLVLIQYARLLDLLMTNPGLS